MGLGGDALAQDLGDAALADAGLTAQQHDLTLARLGLRPAAQQQFHLFLAPHQRRQRHLAVGGIEAAVGGARTHHFEQMHRLGDALECLRTQIGVVEQPFGQHPRALAHHYTARLGQRLQPRGDVGGLAHRSLGDRGVALPGFAHHHQAGVNAYAGAQRCRVPSAWRQLQ